MNNTKNYTREARAYVRVSTFNDSQKDSPENQEGLIREVANSEGISISKVYMDKGTATNIVDREDVQQMLTDAKNGEFDCIYFASLSRFSRDTLDAISLKRMLVNALGLRVVSIEDLYDSAKEDNEMIFTIISSVNQKQSEVTSTASKRGKRQSARKGNFTGSIAPYGYEKVEVDGRKTLKVVEKEAEVVRFIFDSYINNGMGEKNITNHLNEVLNIPSPKGGLWGLTSIQRILQNENYTGYLTFGKSESKKVYEDINDMHNRKKKLIAKDPNSWERTDFQTHEAIITKEMYDEVQSLRLLRGGGKRGGRRGYVNVFAKMIFCKECGSAMVTMGREKELAKTKEVKSYRYLMCSKRRRQGAKGCSNSVWVPYEETRDGIINILQTGIDRLINQEEAIQTYGDISSFAQKDYDKEIDILNKVISENRMLLFELRKSMMLSNIDNEQYEFEKLLYEKEIEEANVKLIQLNKKSKESKDYEALKVSIKNSIDMLSDLDTFDNVEKVRSILLRLIDKIEVSEDGLINISTPLGDLI